MKQCFSSPCETYNLRASYCVSKFIPTPPFTHLGSRAPNKRRRNFFPLVVSYEHYYLTQGVLHFTKHCLSVTFDISFPLCFTPWRNLVFSNFFVLGEFGEMMSDEGEDLFTRTLYIIKMFEVGPHPINNMIAKSRDD